MIGWRLDGDVMVLDVGTKPEDVERDRLAVEHALGRPITTRVTPSATEILDAAIERYGALNAQWEDARKTDPHAKPGEGWSDAHYNLGQAATKVWRETNARRSGNG